MIWLFCSSATTSTSCACCADRTIVLQNGRIVEQGESRAMFDNPKTAYTRELVDAVPHIEMEVPTQATRSAEVR